VLAAEVGSANKFFRSISLMNIGSDETAGARPAVEEPMASLVCLLLFMVRKQIKSRGGNAVLLL